MSACARGRLGNRESRSSGEQFGPPMCRVYEGQACPGSATASMPPTSTASTGSQPICQPKRIINIGLNAGSSGVNAFENAAPADTAAIVLATNRACDMDFWPNIDYLATKSPTNQSVIVDVDLNNNNTWLLNKATGS